MEPPGERLGSRDEPKGPQFLLASPGQPNLSTFLLLLFKSIS
jgi:hypothetical protein